LNKGLESKADSGEPEGAAQKDKIRRHRTQLAGGEGQVHQRAPRNRGGKFRI